MCSLLRSLALVGSLATVVLWVAALGTSEGATVRYASSTDAGCGERSPCYSSIQAAVDVAQPGDTVQIQPGTYVEQVSLVGKNAGAWSEAARVTIEADPDAPVGSVVLRGAVGPCPEAQAIRVQQSRFVTIRGLTITGAGGAGIALLGGGRNVAIRIERNRIVGNGGIECGDGIAIAGGNVGTVILNNLILANGRNGIATVDGEGGLHTVVQNTIHANAWNGLSAIGGHVLLAVNNAITGNGTAPGSAGGRMGVMREPGTLPLPVAITLRNNLICGNRLGEIAGPVLDGTDGGNLTPTGAEGPGVSASPSCDHPTTVYRDLTVATGAVDMPDDPAPGPASPLVDQGLDPRTLLTPDLNPRFEADYYGEAVRPAAGTPGGPPRFDIGAVEARNDARPPMVAFETPMANAHVRGAVSVRAQATDDGGRVVAVTVRADGQAVTARLEPAPPASAVTASASWDTGTVAGGVHTLTATATDQAQNTATATRTVIVDNSPPETEITEGPEGAAGSTHATIRFTGSDNLTPTAGLTFAWRVDGGAYTSFVAVTTADLSGLGPGTHLFEVKSRDQAGNEDPSPAERRFTVSALQIAITEPAGGVTVASGPLLVRGTVGPGGVEVGIAVNGVVAAVDGGSFAALVPVAGPSAALTAVATTPSGGSASHTVVVPVSDLGESAVTLRAHPATGGIPLTTTFSLLTGPVPLRVELDFDGDGQFDLDGATLEGESFTYASPGLYFPRVRMTDSQGAVRTASTVVQVLDGTALDAILQAKWTALRAALAGGDVTAAVSLFAGASREAYRDQLDALARVGALQQVAGDLGPITAVKVRDRAAEYEMRAVQRGIPYSFYVLFVIDTDGLWRLRVF
jgi:hypothetical protein